MLTTIITAASAVLGLTGTAFGVHAAVTDHNRTIL